VFALFEYPPLGFPSILLQRLLQQIENRCAAIVVIIMVLAKFFDLHFLTTVHPIVMILLSSDLYFHYLNIRRRVLHKSYFIADRKSLFHPHCHHHVPNNHF